MDRRSLLSAAAAASLTALAGCTTDGDGGTGGTPTPTPEPTPEPTPTSEPTPTPSPTSGGFTVTDTGFEVLEAACGTGQGGASLDYGRPIVVEGTITGRNACYTAELEDVSHDGDADELTVAVRSYNPKTAGGCAECLTDIDYRAEISYDGHTPESVRVIHNDETVTTATPPS